MGLIHPYKAVDVYVFIKLLEKNIITRFGVPLKLTIDNASIFRSSQTTCFCLDPAIVLSHASNYYLKGNGLSQCCMYCDNIGFIAITSPNRTLAIISPKFIVINSII
jgi:hypothetical protein